MRTARGSMSTPAALCPSNRAATSVDPEPDIGSSTRAVAGSKAVNRYFANGTGIRAGNGCSPAWPDTLASCCAFFSAFNARTTSRSAAAGTSRAFLTLRMTSSLAPAVTFQGRQARPVRRPLGEDSIQRWGAPTYLSPIGRSRTYTVVDHDRLPERGAQLVRDR